MTGIPYTNPISVVAEGLLKGLGIGGLIIGIIAAIGIFLVIVGVAGYLIVTVVDVVAELRNRAAVNAAAEADEAAIRAIRERGRDE